MAIGSQSCTFLGSRPVTGWLTTRPHSPPLNLNSSFYRWPRPAAFSNWRQRLPDGFRLSVKAPWSLTHGRRRHRPGPVPRIETLGEMSAQHAVPVIVLLQTGPRAEPNGAAGGRPPVAVTPLR
jgi:uncharacterized protein YecE (DUF72 family)